MKSSVSLFGFLLINSLFVQTSEHTAQNPEQKKIVPKLKLPLPVPLKQNIVHKELHSDNDRQDSTSTHREENKPLFHFGSSTMMFAYHCAGNKHPYAQHLQSNQY